MFMLKKTTMIKQRMHRFDKMNLSILSVHAVRTLLSLPHAILIMKICIHFNQQSHEYQWTKDHPLEQVIDNPTNPVQIRQQLATDPEMMDFTIRQTTSIGNRLQTIWQDLDKAKVVMEETKKKEDEVSDCIFATKEILVAKGYAQKRAFLKHLSDVEHAEAMILAKALLEDTVPR
ncbi:hypothetical protein Tco_0704099 [Tanacetum coccineum]|uniref:Uncharacterized protein n=1 Tax=Tanacetum coccineum TaxID=301880 RepID=A0ABQ4Y289_9ASTR